MTKTELETIVNDTAGIYTQEQKAKAQAALVDSQNQPNQTSTAVDSMLVALRKQLHQRLLDSTDARDKQSLIDLAHNWPDFATTGKVLGE